ncbi:acyl-CoA thioesterase/bile acid-CoA:amino acid N-acyltransferase family protein [Shouchella hunanensis]|uniref:Acyl-CoA thioesterase/bile acid-CoA:amino acid N-acyltransferase family protein n=1 Tax=Shouchella hunanensis TaxID=766894 RepID=A0ABY7WBF8_9BACI|nr:acyl-CoA thioesterase/bile acid-CoA:amino acid N-acyltransferase family protein [Shouchella hunanensis]WDF04948.1 acyl-CoA thioesterase/bile acid-CoA:amino acid N-acyltransferase family protein [Shouchella hunanensis]
MNQIEVHPTFCMAETANIVDSISIKLKTQQANEKVKLMVQTMDEDNRMFRSEATFKTNSNGMLDVATQAPLSGDYQTVDASGLFWSMKAKDQKEHLFKKHSASPISFYIKASDERGKVIAEQTFTRTFKEEQVVEECLEGKLVGSLYYPKEKKNLPGIVILGGSDGSVHEGAAALLAAQGYGVIALAYFGQGNLPKGIEEIPLEYVNRAYRFLENKPFIDASTFGLIGHSRGSELALLYASKYPKLKAVIASAPSSILFSGMVNFQLTSKSAWTHNNVPLGFLKTERSLKDTVSFFRHWITKKPYSMLSTMEKNLKDEEKMKAHSIPVTEIKAPIMVFAGTDDHVQPAVFFMERIQKALQGHEYADNHIYIKHSGAGHFSAFPSGLPHLPQTIASTNYNMTIMFGGTKKQNAKIAEQSWEETLQFLKEQLKGDR